MTGVLELSILVLAIVAAVILYKVLKTAKSMVINAVIGLVILVLANFALDLKIVYTPIVIVICAIGGTVGALLVIVLHYLGLAF